MMYRLARNGFTLIEVLVALAITSVLTLILYASFSGLTGSSNALESYSLKNRQAVLFLNQMSNDMAGAFYSSALSYADFILTERNMAGENISQISFSCFSQQLIDIHRTATDIIKVTYRPEIDDEGNLFILREVQPNLQIPEYEETLTERVLTGISSFSINALTGEDTSDTEWDSRNKMKLPERIRVSVTFSDSRALSEEFFLRLSGNVSRFGNSGKRNQ